MPSSKSNPKPKPSIRLEFEAIGTQWAIDIQADASKVQSLASLITARIKDFDRAYSRFRTDSLVAAMSRKAGAYMLPDDAQPLLDLYVQMYQHTEGAVTPLVGQVLSDAGYDTHYSLRPKALHQPPAWEEVLQYAYPVLEVSRPALLDFGAAGKGYLVDIIAEILEDCGVAEYCVDAGGDMRCKSSQPMRIGLEDPADTGRVIGAVSLTNGAICGSSGNRRKWAGFNHIIDPRTLQSPDTIAAVWAMAGSAMVADGMTTCLYFAGPDMLQQYFSFEYVIIYTDRTVRASAGFPGELFTTGKGTLHA